MSAVEPHEVNLPRLTLRCPYDHTIKFAEAVGATGDLEIACRKCRNATRHFQPPIAFVVHVFDLATGVCVRTDEVMAD